jgi:hypothetical protein
MQSNEATQKEPQASTLPNFVRYVSVQDFTDKAPYYFENTDGVREYIKGIGDQNVPNDDTVIIDGIRKAIRYIASCSSLIVEEQIKLGYPRDYAFSENDAIKIIAGSLIVWPRENPTLYNFMEMTNRNGSNSQRITTAKILFLRDNASEKAKKHNASDKEITKAKSLIYQLENDAAKLRNIAQILHKDMNAEPEILLQELIRTATETPKVIIDAFGEETGDVSALVFDAQESGIISFNGFSYEFADSKDKISIPNMRGRQTDDNARKKLIDYLMTEEGEPTRQQIQTILKKRNEQLT